MGKKIPEEMAAQKETFKKGCVEGGMKQAVADQLWEQIETFAAYGFNKAHAASYGNLAYKTAYMKANFPVDYMAALLIRRKAATLEKIAEIVAECKRMKIQILPPSVNGSRGNFTVVPLESPGLSESGKAGAFQEAIRFGMYSIKNFGTGVGDSIMKAQEDGGPFTDIGDFLSRIPDKNLNKKSLESLIMCGAMDELGERGQLLAHIETLLGYHREHMNAPTDQGSLFGTFSSAPAKLKLPPAQAASMDTRLAWEKELLGLYVSGHPLDKHKEKLSDTKKTIKYAKEMLRGVDTVVAGFVETERSVVTKSGERMSFLQIADFSGSIEVVLFPRTFKEFGSLASAGSCIMLRGRISERNGESSFVAEKVKAL